MVFERLLSGALVDECLHDCNPNLWRGNRSGPQWRSCEYGVLERSRERGASDRPSMHGHVACRFRIVLGDEQPTHSSPWDSSREVDSSELPTTAHSPDPLRRYAAGHRTELLRHHHPSLSATAS